MIKLNINRYQDISGFLIVYINDYNEIRPMIIECNTKEDLQLIIRLRDIKNVIYTKPLKEIVKNYVKKTELLN